MKKPILFLGPCAAENPQQVQETARLLVQQSPIPFIFRAGAWKPRTRPDTFQGVGELALPWLMATGLPVATEVASVAHIRAAVEAGVSYLWLGARTVANPILVQELASALAADHGAVQAVLVKNPMHEDAELWLGNIARMEQVGLPVYAVHRGCGHRPCWAMAHLLRQRRPDLPLLLDPSHMAGCADRIPSLVSCAAALGYDGVMMEVHYSPSQALSDASQQLTPAEAVDVLQPFFEVKDAVVEDAELRWYRAEIDELDDCLWGTLDARMQVVQRIGAWKKSHGVPALQPHRLAEIIARRRAWAESHGFDPDRAEQLFRLIHEESLSRQ